VLSKLLRPFRSSKNLLIGPSIGVDVGIVKNPGKYLVTSADPITGATRRLGWHAVNVSANDVATSGIMPSTLCAVSLFPRGTKFGEIQTVLDEINTTASKLGIVVAGGHTEITKEVTHPIITVTCFGSGDRFVSAANARTNDSILMTKSAGIEGTSILYSLKRARKSIRHEMVARGLRLIEGMSVVKDAKVAFATGKVHAMHDVTEGGVLGAALEMSIASKIGFKLELSTIPIDESTRVICKQLKIDPLRLIGSGSLMLSCRRSDADEIISVLARRRITCAEIGQFVPNRSFRRLILADGEHENLRETSVEDELWKALGEYR
jgi:hydrogenase expression/formation protein HypE